jgi:hypothetical protein
MRAPGTGAPSTDVNCPLMTPRQLPRGVGGFTGRTPQIAQLDRGGRDDCLSAPRRPVGFAINPVG